MALIKCPECGREISNKSKQCIHCGFPLDEIVSQNSKIDDTKYEIYTAPPITEKYKIIMTDPGINKIRIIEELEDMCNFTSSKAEEIVNSLPSIIKETLSYDTAKQIKDALSEVGAYVSLKTEKCNIPPEINPDSSKYQYFGIKILDTESASQYTRTLLMNARLLNQSTTQIEYSDIVASGIPLQKVEVFIEYLKDNNVKGEIFKDTFNDSINTQMIEFIDKNLNKNSPVCCPRCGSTQITTGQRGFSILTGFLGSNKTVNRCAKCGHSWTP